LKQLTKNCQATFCIPLKNRLGTMAEISILLKKETKFAYGECRKNFNDTVRFLVEHCPNAGFTKFKVQRVINLFEDTGNVQSRPLKSQTRKIYTLCINFEI
jgi:hypothetical protein